MVKGAIALARVVALSAHLFNYGVESPCFQGIHKISPRSLIKGKGNTNDYPEAFR